MVEYATEQAINAFTEALALDPSHEVALAAYRSVPAGRTLGAAGGDLGRAPATLLILTALH